MGAGVGVGIVVGVVIAAVGFVVMWVTRRRKRKTAGVTELDGSPRPQVAHRVDTDLSSELSGGKYANRVELGSVPVTELPADATPGRTES